MHTRYRSTWASYASAGLFAVLGAITGYGAWTRGNAVPLVVAMFCFVLAWGCLASKPSLMRASAAVLLLLAPCSVPLLFNPWGTTELLGRNNISIALYSTCAGAFIVGLVVLAWFLDRDRVQLENSTARGTPDDQLKDTPGRRAS